jgi:hypothetical protein
LTFGRNGRTGQVAFLSHNRRKPARHAAALQPFKPEVERILAGAFRCFARGPFCSGEPNAALRLLSFRADRDDSDFARPAPNLSRGGQG